MWLRETCYLANLILPLLQLDMTPWRPLLELLSWCLVFNTLRQRQNGHYFPDDIFKCIFMNENLSVLIKISLKFVPSGPINNIPVLVQIMAWRCPGDRPLSEPMMVSLVMHICITQPQWVKWSHCNTIGFPWLSCTNAWYLYQLHWIDKDGRVSG